MRHAKDNQLTLIWEGENASNHPALHCVPNTNQLQTSGKPTSMAIVPYFFSASNNSDTLPLTMEVSPSYHSCH